MTVTIGRRELLAALGGAAAWPLLRVPPLPWSRVDGKPPKLPLGRGGPHAAEVMWIMSRVIAVTACGLMLAACSATMPSLSLDFM